MERNISLLLSQQRAELPSGCTELSKWDPAAQGSQASPTTAHVKSGRGPRRQGQDAEHQAGANTDRQHLRCVPPFTGCQLVNEDRASPQGQLSQYRGSSPALALNRVQDRQLFRLDLSALPLSVLKPHFLDFW